MGRKKRKVAVADQGNEEGATAADSSGGGSIVPPPPPLPPPSDPRRMMMMMMQQQQQQQQPKRVLLPNTPEAPLPDEIPNINSNINSNNNSNNDNNNNNNNDSSTIDKSSQKKLSSGYATTSHSAEIIDEDIYVSDGSESDEDLMADLTGVSEEGTEPEESTTATTNVAGRSIEMVLSGSKMGLMRRGIHRPQQLVQPNRQWARHTTPRDDAGGERANGEEGGDGDDAGDAADRRKKQEEEELAKLDPAQRAARLLAEKQRKLEETKILARKLESEENAGRDPCLFSKRTSFDIRFDQIEDKPWERTGDVTDFFNYGFTEDDWLEYAEQQLLIRQELIDASRQKRLPDPSIVPVAPKKPKKQTPRVAVANGSNADGEAMETEGDAGGTADESNATSTIQNHLMGPDAVCVVIGPEKPTTQTRPNAAAAAAAGTKDVAATTEGSTNPAPSDDFVDVTVGVGGAWGMGAAPGSTLAKLIEAQERQQQQPPPPPPQQQQQHSKHHLYNDNHQSGHRQYGETMHEAPSTKGGDSASSRKGRDAGYYGGSNNNSKSHYEDNSAPSYHGNGGAGDGGAGGYNANGQQHYSNSQQQQQQQQPGWNNHNHNSQPTDTSITSSAGGGGSGGGDPRNSRYHQSDAGGGGGGPPFKSGGGSDRSSSRNSERYQQQPPPPPSYYGNEGGSRSGYRGRSGGGRRGGGGGGGDYGGGRDRERDRDRHRGGSRGDRGDYQQRKRPRDDRYRR